MFVANRLDTTQSISAVCPSCKQRGHFFHAGDQKVPERVAKKMGLDEPVIPLWHCPNCKSTISEPDLKDVHG